MIRRDNQFRAGADHQEGGDAEIYENINYRFCLEISDNQPSIKIKGEILMRTVKIYFLILSFALAMASVSHLPANQASASTQDPTG